jgi:Cu/Ag efflux protein CusF
MNRTPPVLAGAAVASALFLAIAKAVAAGNATPAPAADPNAAKSPALATGEIRQVDKSAGKLTIKHGPLRNLDMPGMTMAFNVSDPSMLERVKAGDRVDFVAENVRGALTVVRLDLAR